MAGKQDEKRKAAKPGKRREKRAQDAAPGKDPKGAKPRKDAKGAKDPKPGKGTKDPKPGKDAKPGKGAKRGRPAKRPGADGSGARPLRELLRVTPGERPDLGSLDPSSTPGGPAGKAAGAEATAALAQPLGALQERLYAASTAGDRRRLLLVLQGMDTSGKGGTLKHVIGLFNPSGCRIKAFKAPTAEELEHPFLWRIKRELPRPGEIGIFDRSHYEDVLIARVRALVPPHRVRTRYAQINRFEKALADDGVTVVKVFLHIGYEEQRTRLLQRLDDPDKHWKFNVGDIEERGAWPAYQEAYEVALERCSTDAAPWYVVPANRKWYRNWAISTLLREHLEEIDPQYPKGDFDVEECRRRLLEG
ncbi:phosphate--nucleotide phosphotransferase [Streptomyces venezuelae]|uniref:Phosphate--nucleotide phosphotransferase n=1 Tax=Streptomyces venezuelae TaxID=54571 RepID=A0A5P2DPW7_STRVZ|nr:PPK2 family polyphosphate kinase [Streptomyces venezuelae]QES57252.1 phosphate--nucleotide phosphotransferase [Streptomyces venezuelae]